MQESAASRVRFGPFELDIRSGELRKGRTRLRVADQSIEILKALLEHAGELVTREQLRERLWPSNTFVDFEHGLNAAIRRLREALGDSADAPKFIETVPRRGYRFIGRVDGERMWDTAAPPSVVMPLPPAPSDLGGAHPIQPQRDARSPLSLRRFQLRPVMLTASIAVALSIGVWLGRRDHAGTLGRAPVGTSVPVTSSPGLEIDPTLSPDGNQIAFAWEGAAGDNLDIYVKSIDGGDPVRLTTDAATDRAPAWSPDGRRIAFLRTTGVTRDAIMIMPALGGPQRRLIEADAREKGPLWADWISWTPDGSGILYSDRDPSSTTFAVFMCSLESGERQQLTSPTRDFEDQAPTISPDGRHLAFVRRTLGYVIGSVFVQPLDGLRPVGEPRQLSRLSDRAFSVAWSHDGTSLFYDSGGRGETGLWRVPLEGGPSELVLSNVRASRPTVSRDGKRLFYQVATTDMNIWRMPGPENTDPTESASAPVRVVASTFFDMSPQFSSDGKRIAFVSFRSGNAEIWSSSSDGTQAAQLTAFGGPYLGSPRWSANCEEIAFDSMRSGSWNIYVGTIRDGRVRAVTAERSNNIRPSWSRDGQWIYFGSNRSGDWQLWKVSPSGGAAIQITRKGGQEPFESPSGQYLYYVKADPRSGIWQVPVNGGEEVRVIERGAPGFWAVTDRGIVLADPFAGSGQTTEFFSFELQRLVPVARPLPRLRPGSGSPAFAASRDGRWILYGHYDEWGSDIHMLEGSW